MIKVKNKREAWYIADLLFPGDYIEDEFKSSRAGYKIYTGTQNRLNQIADLGNRLEIMTNKLDLNIWI